MNRFRNDYFMEKLLFEKRVMKKIKVIKIEAIIKNKLQLWLYPLSIFFIIFPSFLGKLTINFHSF